MSGTLIRFGTEVCQNPKIRQISIYLTPAVKIRGGVGEMSESDRNSIIVAQGGSIRFPMSFFRFEATMYQKLLMSKTEAKVRTF